MAPFHVFEALADEVFCYEERQWDGCQVIKYSFQDEKLEQPFAPNLPIIGQLAQQDCKLLHLMKVQSQKEAKRKQILKLIYGNLVLEQRAVGRNRLYFPEWLEINLNYFLKIIQTTLDCYKNPNSSKIEHKFKFEGGGVLINCLYS